MATLEEMQQLLEALRTEIAAIRAEQKPADPLQQFVDHMTPAQRQICKSVRITEQDYAKNTREYMHFEQTGQYPPEWSNEGDQS